MPQALNFDLFDGNTIDITKHGRTWQLRDDVPAKTLMRAFLLLSVQEQLQRAVAEAQAENPDDLEGAVAALEAKYDALERKAAKPIGDIFRHTYPGTTDEELLEAFSFEQLQRIAQHFFSSRSQVSSQQPDATMPLSTATAKSNSSRAQRRASGTRS